MDLTTYPQQINHSIHNNHWNVNAFMNPATSMPQTYMFEQSSTLVDTPLTSMYYPSSDLDQNMSPPEHALSSHDLFSFHHNQPQTQQYHNQQAHQNLINTSLPPKDFQLCLATPPMSAFGMHFPSQPSPPESDHLPSTPQSKRDRITFNEKRKRIILRNLFSKLNESIPPLKTSRHTRYRSLIHASLYIKRLQSNISQLNQLSNHLETHHTMYHLPLPMNAKNFSNDQPTQPSIPFGY